MDKPILAMTYEHIDRWIASIQAKLIEEDFACVIGILRGGAPLALMVSHVSGAPVAFLRYYRAQRAAVWDSSIPVPAPGSKVLLCEDISGLGHTLSDCYGYLKILGMEVKTLTAGYDEKSLIQPDYSVDGKGYTLLFPWERQAYTLNYRARWEHTEGGSKGAMGADHDYDVYAIDLDGILLNDIEPHRYDSNLEQALSERDALPVFSNVPPKHRVNAIITGRPEIDRARTQKWLDKNNFDGLMLVMRDPASHDDSPKQVADHKAIAALRLGCTHFVESDPVQALHIAAAAPLIRVIWWDSAMNQARLIGASGYEGFSLDTI